MAQEASSTLQTLAAASARQLAYAAEFKWSTGLILDPLAVGSVLGDGDWSDESSYIVEMRGDMQAIGWQHGLGAVGHGVSNVVYITLNNTGGRFAIVHGGGALSDGGVPYQKRGRVAIGFASGGTDYTVQQITGYIVNAKEDQTTGKVTMELRDRGAMLVHEQGNSLLYADQGAGEYITTIASTLMGAGEKLGGVEVVPIDALDSGTWEVMDSSEPDHNTIIYSPGMIPMQYCWVDDESYWEEMSLCAEAQLGRVYFDKMSALHFEDGAHFVTPRAVDRINPLISQYTFDSGDYAACNVVVDYTSLYNDITVEYYERYKSVEQIVWEADQVHVIPPNTSTTITGYFRYPVIEAMDLTQGTDYDAVNASGASLNSDLTITANVYAQRVVFDVANGSSSGMFLTGLQLRGHPALPFQSDRYQTDDEDSVETYGRRSWKITNPYIQGYRHAEMIGEFLLNRFKEPLTYVRLTGVRGVPWLEVGDRVTVEADNLESASEDYFIVRMAWSFGPNRAYSMDLDLLKCSDVFTNTNYFQLNQSHYGDYSLLFW